MNSRWVPGFTVVELLISVVIIAILASVVVVGFNGVTRSAHRVSLQSDLKNAASLMEQQYVRDGAFPSTLPAEFKHSEGSTLTLVNSGGLVKYQNLSAVQNGVLFAQICDDLITEGLGNGKDQAGNTRKYLEWCGNWNVGNTQVTGWESQVWSTPVSKEQLLKYANDFHTNSTWDKDQERVVKNFYTQLVSRLEAQGGYFPITRFWDDWATPGNGVMKESLAGHETPSDQSFCLEGTHQNIPREFWHIKNEGTLTAGQC